MFQSWQTWRCGNPFSAGTWRNNPRLVLETVAVRSSKSTWKRWNFKSFWLERRCLIASDCTVGVFVVHALKRNTACFQSWFTYAVIVNITILHSDTVSYLKSWQSFLLDNKHAVFSECVNRLIYRLSRSEQKFSFFHLHVLRYLVYLWSVLLLFCHPNVGVKS
jgi:hypothetical protein